MSFGLREGVILLIVLVAIYMLYVLISMRSLRRKTVTPPPVPAPAGDARPAAEPLLSLDDDSESIPPAVGNAWNHAAAEMAEGVLRHGLEQELEQLRDEVDILRGELAAMRQDMKHELTQMRASQTVSPVYGDAMQLALSGYSPEAIAERCGIARAEAELVVALAKSREQ